MSREPTHRLKLRLGYIEMEGEGLPAVIGSLLIAALAVWLLYATR